MHRVSIAVLVLVLLAAFGCKKPDPPTLTPKQATVTGLTLAGVDLQLDVDALNPNSFDLQAQRVTARVVVDGKYDVGTVTVNSGLTLPAGKSVTISVPVSVKWTDLTQMVTLAAANRPIPYTVEGTATIGGSTLNVDLPFHLDGTLTQAQLTQAALNSLPGGLKTPSR